ncbi:DUF3892 domain-containing protein [Lysinibacillus xylanilyticus]|uniref:DUF3892 domain-containing protein n=1 Tax=Lysinibacillus xylanilyticus TaxID=582475 RepID=UPI0036D86289
MKRKDYEPYTEFDLEKVKEATKKHYEEMASEIDMEELRQAAMETEHEIPPLHHTNNSPNKKTIVAVRRNMDGDTMAVKFDDNSVALMNEAIEMAERDEINNVNTGMSKLGHKTLKSNRDEYEENNLSRLPEF